MFKMLDRHFIAVVLLATLTTVSGCCILYPCSHCNTGPDCSRCDDGPDCDCCDDRPDCDCCDDRPDCDRCRDRPKRYAPDDGPVPPKCMQCICEVESRCVMPDPVCGNDAGSPSSCGPYQIQQIYWDDAVSKEDTLEGDWKKCTSTMECSKRTVQGYMKRYATAEELGRTPTCEDFSRVHDGGPNGYKNPATLKYWAKVQECLEK